MDGVSQIFYAESEESEVPLCSDLKERHRLNYTTQRFLLCHRFDLIRGNSSGPSAGSASYVELMRIDKLRLTVSIGTASKEVEASSEGRFPVIGIAWAISGGFRSYL